MIRLTSFLRRKLAERRLAKMREHNLRSFELQDYIRRREAALKARRAASA